MVQKKVDKYFRLQNYEKLINLFYSESQFFFLKIEKRLFSIKKWRNMYSKAPWVISKHSSTAWRCCKCSCTLRNSLSCRVLKQQNVQTTGTVSCTCCYFTGAGSSFSFWRADWSASLQSSSQMAASAGCTDKTSVISPRRRRVAQNCFVFLFFSFLFVIYVIKKGHNVQEEQM